MNLGTKFFATAVLTLISVTSVYSEEAQYANKTNIRVGVIDRFSPNSFISSIVPIFDYLEKKFPNLEIDFVDISINATDKDIAELKLDLLISSSWDFALLQPLLGIQQIVTRKPKSSDNVLESVGSTIFVRKDNSSVNSLNDLKGRSVVTATTDSIEDWFGVLGEISKLGVNPEKFFGHTKLTRHSIPGVLSEIANKKIEIGILPTCEFERLIDEGRFKKDQFKVINSLGNSSCVRSTRLYPDAVISFFPQVPSSLVRDITIALLSMDQSEHDFEWIFASSFISINELMKSLQLGPFSSLREFTIKRFLEEYRQEIFLAFLLLLFWLVHTLRLRYKLNQRSCELSEEMEKRRMSEQKLNEHQKKLLELERGHSLTQLSSIFAHEVKQPLASILYYATILKKVNPSHEGAKEHIIFSADKIQKNAERTVKIVDHVRKYVKLANPTPSVQCFNDIVQRTVKSQKELNKVSFLKIDIIATADVTVLVDPLELELVIENLLKNALYAAKQTSNPFISLKTNMSKKTLFINIENNGNVISDENFKLLGIKAHTEKSEGLGAGLLICNSILEKYSSSLKFEKRSLGGLIVSFSLSINTGHQEYE